MLQKLIVLAVGVLMFMAGGLIAVQPGDTLLDEQNYGLSIGEGPDPGADVSFQLGQGQLSEIVVTYDSNASMGKREVWAMVGYRFPTHMLLEAIGRFVNESIVSFRLGWVNASYATIFVTHFMVRVFYHSIGVVDVNITVTKLGSPFTPVGVVLLAVSSIPFWVLVVSSRRQWRWQLTTSGD